MTRTMQAAKQALARIAADARGVTTALNFLATRLPALRWGGVIHHH